MGYFSTLLSAQAHSLRLPEDSRDEVERIVIQHQKSGSSRERAPFSRQLDFWAFCIGAAVAKGKPPVEGPSTKWGRKFADTRSVQLSDDLCDLLAVLALTELGPDHEGLNDPAEIVEVGNRLAAAGCAEVLERLGDADLRLTTLDKALDYAATLKRVAQE